MESYWTYPFVFGIFCSTFNLWRFTHMVMCGCSSFTLITIYGSILWKVYYILLHVTGGHCLILFESQWNHLLYRTLSITDLYLNNKVVLGEGSLTRNGLNQCWFAMLRRGHLTELVYKKEKKKKEKGRKEKKRGCLNLFRLLSQKTTD